MTPTPKGMGRASSANGEMRHIGIVGGGAWGTALAQSVRKRGLDVTLWAYEFDTVCEINQHHTNRVYLPGVTLDAGIKATGKVGNLGSCDLILLVAPSQFVGMVTRDLGAVASGQPIVVCTKGFEEETGRLMSDVVKAAIPASPVAVLSGPSFASEVARGLPAALTLASDDEALGTAIAATLGHRAFRVYWTDDVVGAQVGGAVKNVVAIAAGIVDGRKYGASAHAALTTRGFAELARFGLSMGARFETLTGLSGLGDLILTCSSSNSRNMSLGQELGRGRAMTDVLGARRSVTEGVVSASAVVTKAKTLGVEMPICEAVGRIVKGAATIDEAIDQVLSRPFKPEAGR